MKKIIMILMAMALMVPSAIAQNNKALEKARKKEYKEKIKTYNKEGWKLYGSSRSVEVALLLHYEKLDKLGDRAHEVMGEASKFKSKNVGMQSAINNACNKYAREAGSHVKGRIVSDMANMTEDVSGEFDHFYAAYETTVEKEIKGEMQQSYAMIKDNGDGTFAMQVFFIVDEDAASKARIRAMENAFKESEKAQQYATKVSEFVKEGFKDEK